LQRIFLGHVGLPIATKFDIHNCLAKEKIRHPFANFSAIAAVAAPYPKVIIFRGLQTDHVTGLTTLKVSRSEVKVVKSGKSLATHCVTNVPINESMNQSINTIFSELCKIT